MNRQIIDFKSWNLFFPGAKNFNPWLTPLIIRINLNLIDSMGVF